MSEFKDKAVSGMFWASVEKFGVQVVQFVLGIILARLLTPSDYGMIGMLVVFSAIAKIFVDSGFSSALIQKGSCTQVDYSTVFFFNVGIGILCYGICFFSASGIAAFYEMPELENLSKVLFLNIIFNSVVALQATKLRIELNFKLQSKISIITSILTGVIAIIAAYNGFGVWALVIQSLSSSLLTILCFYLATKWRPSLVFSWAALKGMFKFGSNLLAANLLGTIFENLYQLTIGKFCNAVDVGLYNRAYHFVRLPSITIVDILVKVNYPLLAQCKDDDERLKSVYTKLLRTPMFLLYPILFIMAALAKPLILFLLGEKWIECALLLSILAIGCLFQPLAGINVYLLYVKGRSDAALKLDFFKKPLMLGILLACLPFGLVWICVGRALYSFIGFAVNCYYTNKIMGFGFVKQLASLMPLFGYGLASFAAAYACTLCFSTPLAQLLVGSVFGAGVYLLLSFIFKDQALADFKTIISQKIHHK